MHPSPSASADFDIRIRRIAALLYAVAIGMLCLYANLPPHLPDVDWRALNLIALPALLSLVVVWSFPWHRFHRLLFLAVTLSALALVAVAVAVSGGWRSPLVLFYAFAVLFNAAYYPRPLAFILNGLVVLCSLAPALYRPAVGPLVAYLALIAPGILCIGVVADLLIHEVRRREREVGALVAQRAERERELARLAALHRPGVAVAAELDAQRAMEAVVHELAVSLSYRFVGIYLREGESQCLRAQVGYAVPLERIGPGEGVIGRVYRTGRSILVEDVRTDPDFIPVGPAVASEVCVPILWDRAAIGVINIESAGRLDRGDLEVLELFAQQVAAALANADVHAATVAAAGRDALTGALNHGALLAALDGGIGAARRANGPLAVLFADVDGFKRHNDRHGHAFGDGVLRACARAMRAELAPGDALGRYGGDEFVAVLAGADHERALLVAEAIREGVARCRFEPPGGGGEDAVTISVGVVSAPGHGATCDRLLAAADRALYAAKGGGRNRVQLAAPAG